MYILMCLLFVSSGIHTIISDSVFLLGIPHHRCVSPVVFAVRVIRNTHNYICISPGDSPSQVCVSCCVCCPCRQAYTQLYLYSSWGFPITGVYLLLCLLSVSSGIHTIISVFLLGIQHHRCVSPVVFAVRVIRHTHNYICIPPGDSPSQVCISFCVCCPCHQAYTQLYLYSSWGFPITGQCGTNMKTTPFHIDHEPNFWGFSS